MTELLIYTIRPNNTALWLPEELATLVGAKKGDKLTTDQYGHQAIQRLIADRSVKKEKKSE